MTHYDFKSGQPMTQKQFETEMDAITPSNPTWRAASGQIYRNLRSGKDRRASAIAPAAEPPASERQEGGDHYLKLAIKPLEYSMANGLDPIQHTAIKYVTRFRDKDGLADLRKAIHCIELLIEHETKTSTTTKG